MREIKLSEIRARQDECFRGGGTRVTNCVQHINLHLNDRPHDCLLCQADLRNEFGRAVNINEWLNGQLDKARTDIPYLLDLVSKLGKKISQIGDVTGHTYDCPEGLTEARVLHQISTTTQPCSELCKEARELLKELEQ
jgi:hypothetical protein